MLKPTDSFEEYISMITSNFKKETNNLYVYLSLEDKRIYNIRFGIITLVKLHNNIPLTDIEEMFINSHLINYDYHKEITKCIVEMAYNISSDTYKRADNVLALELEYDKLYDRSYVALFDSNNQQFFDPSKYDESKGCYCKRIYAADVYKDYPKSLDEYLCNLKEILTENKKISKSYLKNDKISTKTKCFTKV